MQNPSFQEDHSSQIPALQLFIKMGYTYLSPEKALQLREGKSANVLLEPILREQLHKINTAKVSSQREVSFSENSIEQAILVLKNVAMVDGFSATAQRIYELLTLGFSVEQNVEGNKKTFDINFIDWQNINSNQFHVTEEFSVQRTGRKDHYRPDIVLFVNGIPLGVIECKRPDVKNALSEAISQNLRNQQEDGIRQLFIYAQVVMSISGNAGSYATTGTKEKFWAKWLEKFSNKSEEKSYQEKLFQLKNKKLSAKENQVLFADRYKYIKTFFEELEKEQIQPTKQDEYLFNLLHPERLLDLSHNFILFDNGDKKIARYQQFFAIKKAMRQITQPLEKQNQARTGGVVWHTQGSGKSLTMVMLAQAIAMHPEISNPKIILVTDRTDLDKQITKTFEKCGHTVQNAKSGSKLANLLKSKSDAVVTTIINKFETAVRKISQPLQSNNIFVLVDEGHRTQHGIFNIEMQKSLPNACFIAFTGTPLFKKDKNTLGKFGTLIDTYTVDQAVEDKAVIPLLYEGRHVMQDVNASPLDNFFGMISEPLSDYEKADLKKKFSRADQLNIAEQKIHAIAWDISKHYKKNFKGTVFKGQVVCQNKLSAVRYKKYFDEIGMVTSELIMSAPNEREGEESAYGKTKEEVKIFWHEMMDKYGNSKRYQENIVNAFKNTEEPELIIVVDKLLTGFDAPKNTVLYLTRKLIGHTLLQAIARVNRVYKDKDYGYIIDYYGVLEELDGALKLYSGFEDFDEEDISGTLANINKEIEKLPQAHSDLKQLFSGVKNKKDLEAYQSHLRDESIRVKFYEALSKYARLLKLALSSIDFHKTTEDKLMRTYKEDLSFFVKLKNAVSGRYSDKVDYRKYEGQIQKLIDTHIPADEIIQMHEQVNIFDKEAFEEEVEKTVGEVAKADKIASRTEKHITEKMDEDPAFYKRFSQLIKETIDDYLQQRINEKEYLEKITSIKEQVLAHENTELPETLKNKPVASAFYGIVNEEFENLLSDDQVLKVISENLAIEADEIILKYKKVDWEKSVDIPKKMLLEIGDYIIDEIRDKYDLKLSFDKIDTIAQRMIDVAKKRYT